MLLVLVGAGVLIVEVAAAVSGALLAGRRRGIREGGGTDRELV